MYSQYLNSITFFIHIPDFPVYLNVLSCVKIVTVFHGVCHSTHLNHLSFSLYASEVPLTSLKLLYSTLISDLQLVLSLYESDFFRSMYLHIIEVLEKIIYFFKHIRLASSAQCFK